MSDPVRTNRHEGAPKTAPRSAAPEEPPEEPPPKASGETQGKVSECLPEHAPDTAPEVVQMRPGRMPRSWRTETKPHPFCPGCGHGIILRALGEAIDDLGIAARTVYGCDIGCSLLSWNLFNLDTVQTHHGRTIPVIVGIKRARPDLVGIAYMGDGGAYAIGAQHLVSAAIRNEKITVIVCNNTVYAMTGGQLAPTTLSGQKTTTTPYGRDPLETGLPVSGPELVTCIRTEGVYAARGTVANFRQLKLFIKRALENQMAGRGLSFVEALSTCPTNWRTGPKETWRFLEHEMGKVFRIGEFSRDEAEGKAEGQERREGRLSSPAEAGIPRGGNEGARANH